MLFDYDSISKTKGIREHVIIYDSLFNKESHYEELMHEFFILHYTCMYTGILVCVCIYMHAWIFMYVSMREYTPYENVI